MEEIEEQLEQLAEMLSPELRERIGPALEELRQAVVAMRLADTVREDAREALELALRFYQQASEDQDRAAEHLRRAQELLGIEE